ncbi:hypothetical protein JW752_00530 [Candidatus Peregrinibacteria bacterium]|nr:hypothetical protein [Candidatus Peregrinibacteria bacterium]
MTLPTYKISKCFILALFLTALLPFGSFAAEESDQGTIEINIFNREGERVVGNWYLHRGILQMNTIVRNGASGEVFSQPEGTYFLEAQKSNYYPFRRIESDNPQWLTAGETIVYNVRYFKTEEEMLAYDERTPLTAEEAAEPAPAPAPEATEPPAPNPPAPAYNPYNDRTYMGPEGLYPPAAPVPAPTAFDLSAPLQLAQTGAPALMLLIGSAVLGGLITRKRK